MLPEPLLIVVDYAEDKPDEIGRAFSFASGRPVGRKIRVVLLARGAGDWWRTLPDVAPSVRDLWDGPTIGAPREIAALAAGAGDRRSEFERARRVFSDHLGSVGPPGEPPDLAADDFAPVLMLHMAALASAEGKSIAGADQLFDYILSREAEIWARGLEALRLDLSTDALRQGIALLPLTQGAAHAEEAEGVLRRAPLLEDLVADPLHRLLGLIRRLYPVAGADARRVEPLRPDLLGEELVERALELWPELLDKALEIAPDRALPVMGRLALRRQQAGKVLPYEQLAKLESAVPEQTLALRDIAALLLEQMRCWLMGIERPWPEELASEVARVSNNLANRLSALGRREDALVAAEEAVRLRRTLAAARPDAFTPDLAMSLNNLANFLSALGRREDALAAAEEARDLYRALAAARPDAFTPDLAMSLNNLAAFLSDLGRREDALAAAEEAVRLRRALAAARPDAFSPDLAASLNNLAGCLSDLGRREDALAAAEEAVRLRRTLAAARPDPFTPDLASSLNNLANCLSDLGRREDALAAAEEAVRLRRTLAAARPDPFTPDLAGSLNNLANRLSALGRREDALAAAEEAVRLRRTLAAARPDAFTPNLAGSLAVLANCLEAVGREGDALDADEAAIAALRAPFLALPAAFAHWMAPMCEQYIERSEKLGREPDAGLLAPIAEALQQMGAGREPEGEAGA